MSSCGGDHYVAAADVFQKRLEGPVADELNSDGRCKMEAAVDFCHEVVDKALVVSGAFDEGQATIQEMLDVVQMPRRKVIQNQDLLASLDEGVRQVASDKARPPGYEITNGVLLSRT